MTAGASPRDPLHELARIDLQENDRLQRSAQLPQQLVQGTRLLEIARKAIEDEPTLGVGLDQPLADHTEDDIVGNQLAGIHGCLRGTAELAAGGHRCAEQIACRDLWNAMFLSQALGLGAFAGARCTQENDSHVVGTTRPEPPEAGTPRYRPRGIGSIKCYSRVPLNHCSAGCVMPHSKSGSGRRTPKRNAFYAQSGGVSAVINASACGVIEAAARHSRHIGRLYAGRHGIIGALTEDLIDVGRESRATIRGLKYTPAGAFGSARFKLKGLAENRAEYERLIEVFRAHDIGYFFYNGGNDSMDTALKVSQLSESLGYPITCVGVPKTVDNDLPHTDCCPGFGSVAKFIAVSTREAGLDVASMARTSTKVFVLEVMGRHAGWIAAAGGLAGRKPEEPPHIILFPEIPFDQAAFLQKVKQCVTQYGYCVVVVSEGAAYPDGRFLADAGTTDSFGHTQLGGVGPVVANMVREAHGYKYHWAVADYLQRAARHIASRVDVEQAYAVGRAAVELAVKGVNAVMPIIVRKSSRPYRWSIGHVPLGAVANQEKKMPREFITAEGFGITAPCRRYLEPLIGGEDYPPYSAGLPSYVHLKGVSVRKRLKSGFAV